jgi:hypothetical protein
MLNAILIGRRFVKIIMIYYDIALRPPPILATPRLPAGW